MKNKLMALCATALVLVLAGLAQPALAADITISADITTSETWTPDNTYILDGVIYVTNGATLTILPGTVVRGLPESSPGANDPGSLVITRGSKARILGTKTAPVVFTDQFDDNVRGNAFPSPQYADRFNAQGLTGQWGGFIMLGRTYVANNTAGGPDASREVQIEGLVPDARGLYGNCSAVFDPTDDPCVCDDDDSGTIRYMSVRYGGFNLSDANEINGITLGAVGRETEFSFAEVYQNKDDGFEFFGGTVHLNNIAVANVGDDSIDQDEGFRGKIQFAYVQQGQPGADRSDKGGELDGGNSPDGSEPYAIPTIHNVTMVGLGGVKEFDGRSSNNATIFRDNAGGRWGNSAFLDFGGALLDLEGPAQDPVNGTGTTTCDRTIAEYAPNYGVANEGDPSCFHPDAFYDESVAGNIPTLNQQLEVAYSTYYCFGTPSVVGECDLPNGGLLGDSTLANEYLPCGDPLPIRQLDRTDSGDPLTPDFIDIVDPRPADGSPLLTGSVLPQPDDGFFVKTSYRGAFGDKNWLEGWSTLDALGYFPEKPVEVINSDITASTTFNADTIYELAQPIYVTDGSTLTIEPGTVIRSRGESAPGANDPGTIIVTRGSKIHAVGTPHHPIIFTNLEDDNVPGNPAPTPPWDDKFNALGQTGTWGGVIMLGRTYVANNTAGGPDASREVQIEGLVPDDRGLYGNCSAVFDPTDDPCVCDDDDSGKLKYFNIRYGGFNLSDANEINGLTLGAVGRGTEIGFGEILQNKDDGIEFFGGTVYLNNMVVANVGDDSVDQDEGFRGKLQFVFVLQGQPGADRSDKGGELDGGNSPDGSEPYAIPTVANVTMIGLGGEKTFDGRGSNNATIFRDNAGGRWFQSAFLDFGGSVLDVEGPAQDPVNGTGTTSCDRTIATYPRSYGVANEGDPSCFHPNPPFETRELTIQNSTYWCFGSGSALAGECDLADGGLFGPNLGNEYLACDTDAPNPIRTLVRTDSGDPTTPDFVEFVDPRPYPGSPLVTSPTDPFWAAGNAFFKPTGYRGAFSESMNWADGWTTLSRLGYFPTCDPADTERDDAIPNPTMNLFFDTSGTTLVKWDHYARNGELTTYDVLSSGAADDFSAATCVESGDTDLMADVSAEPLAGDALFILVRANNRCGGTLGGDYLGSERSGTTCAP